MNNTYKNLEYDILFFFSADGQLSEPEMAAASDLAIENDKQRFFDAWTAKRENKEWSGDVEQKKNELFRQRRKPGSQMMVGVSPLRPTEPDKEE